MRLYSRPVFSGLLGDPGHALGVISLVDIYTRLLRSSMEICPAWSMAGRPTQQARGCRLFENSRFTELGSPQMFTHPLCVLLCISDGQQGQGVCTTFLKYVGMEKYLPWKRQACKE